MKKKFIILIQFSLIILYVLKIKKVFFIFPQAMRLYNLQLPLLELLKKEYLHFPRYMVVYPSIFLGELFSIDIHIINTFYSIGLLLLTIILWWNIFERYNIKINFLSFLITTFFFISLLTYINGRIVFGYFSEMLLINYFSQYKFKINPVVCLGLFFSTVSSGVMSVIIIVCFFFCYLDRNRLSKGNVFSKIFLKLPVVFCVCYYFYIFLKKNLLYYSRNIFLMASHGIFRDIFNIPIYLLFIFMFEFFIFFILSFIVLKKVRYRLSIFYLAGEIGLIFGITAGTLLFPVIITYILIIFNSKKINTKYCFEEEYE